MRIIFALGIALFAASLQAQSPPVSPIKIDLEPTDGHQLITKMLNHADQINYQGTFVFMHNGQLDSMRIVHGVVDGEVKERLTSLSGEPREVVRDNQTVTCVWPER
ncbi:MAG: sigma-E factor regulatory protein RseB domain-containing protein, partial [Gammaproteobacteria bacterium]